VAKAKWKNSTKTAFCFIYDRYVKFIGAKWEKPAFKKEQRLPFIPTEQEIDSLIASANINTASLLQLLKETGVRIGEARMLKWIDLDTQRKTINVTPEKGSNPRILPISDKLLAMLNQLNRNNESIFASKEKSIRTRIDAHKNRVAKKLDNPRLKQISFHTFRHWKAAMEYHKTKDIIHVKQILGHRNILSTMIYINIEQATFLADTDEWTCKIADTPEEAVKLIEAGFIYVNSMGEKTIYKKRK
jgi:integrase/recombinase XerD